MASVGVHVAASAHLQGGRVVLHLRQPLSDLAVGHGAAQGVVGRLQELQLLLVLSQGLRVAPWAGGTGFSLAGQRARGREGQWGSGRPALRKAPPVPPPTPRPPGSSLPGPDSTPRTMASQELPQLVADGCLLPQLPAPLGLSLGLT